MIVIGQPSKCLEDACYTHLQLQPSICVGKGVNTREYHIVILITFHFNKSCGRVAEEERVCEAVGELAVRVGAEHGQHRHRLRDVDVDEDVARVCARPGLAGVVVADEVEVAQHLLFADVVTNRRRPPRVARLLPAPRPQCCR